MARRRSKARRVARRVTYSPKTGVHVEGTVVWMDGASARGLVFLSHAHVRPPRGTARILATRQTAILAGLSETQDLLTSPYDRPFSVGDLDLELSPAGHIPGSAALLMRWEGTRFLYAGSVNPTKGPTAAEPCQTPKCDQLVLACRYGHPRFVFPPPFQELERLIHRVKELLGQGRTPIFLLSEPLGKAQALAAVLHAEGFEVWAHKKICTGCARYRKLGLPAGQPHRVGGAKPISGPVLWLQTAGPSKALSALSAPVRLLVSGAAADPVLLGQSKAHEGFVLSDHADFPGLLSYVEQTSPTQVFLIPGRPHGLAAELTRRGHRVSVLHPTQLGLF